MRKYRVFDIVWDMDTDYEDELSYNLPPGTRLIKPKLPSEVIIEVDDDFDPMEEIADRLSDKYGWCIESSSFVGVHPVEEAT